MMKIKNNLATGILIGFGLIVVPLILMSSVAPQTESKVIYMSPESHVWEFHLNNPSSHAANGPGASNASAFAINKETGEVRKYETNFNRMTKCNFGAYNVARQHEDK